MHTHDIERRIPSEIPVLYREVTGSYVEQLREAVDDPAHSIVHDYPRHFTIPKSVAKIAVEQHGLTVVHNKLAALQETLPATMAYAIDSVAILQSGSRYNLTVLPSLQTQKNLKEEARAVNNYLKVPFPIRYPVLASCFDKTLITTAEERLNAFFAEKRDRAYLQLGSPILRYVSSGKPNGKK